MQNHQKKSTVFDNNDENSEKTEGIFDSNESEYSFEGFKIEINKKVMLTPINNSKKQRQNNG